MNFKRINKYAAASKLIPMAVIVAVVFVLYFGMATGWTFHPPWVIDYVNAMALSVRSFRLDIPNPPMTYDLISYNGRWYIPWGLLAPLVHIPLQLLVGGRFVPPIYTGLLFGSLTVGTVWWALRRLRDDWFPRQSVWMPLFGTFLYAFGTMQFYVSTVGSVWYVNQAVSTFIGVFGVAVILKKKRSIADYICSVACCSLTLLGRPTLVFLVIIPFFLFLYDTKQHASDRRKIVWLILPIMFTTALFLFYNAARFGNPFETGYRYIQEDPDLARNRQRYGMFSVFHAPRNLWHMTVASPHFFWKKGPVIDIDLAGNSIFVLSPLLALAFCTLPWVWSKTRTYTHVIMALWLGIAATALPTILYYSTGWMQFGYRYALDFSFLLIILIYFWSAGRIRWWMVPFFLYTLWVNYTGIRLLQ
ncbi:MAG: hypothetical protein AAB557_00430 [Patescibacteria group bacterium]